MVKVISLSEEAYKEMKAAKRENESFSDVALRILHEKKQKPLVDFFGIWKDDKELNNVQKILDEDRKKFKTREAIF